MRRFILLFLLLMPLSVFAANPTRDTSTSRSSNCDSPSDTSTASSTTTTTQRIDSDLAPSVKSNSDSSINRVRRSNWHSFLPGMFR